jgi:hypothetical protein
MLSGWLVQRSKYADPTAKNVYILVQPQVEVIINRNEVV